MFVEYAKTHPDFEEKLNGVASGEYKVVARTNYKLIFITEDTQKLTTTWNVEVSQDLNGHFERIELKHGDKRHSLTLS